MTSDLDLLRQFARENSQDAFNEIVRRHLNLVYSAASRQVRSPQLAEEIAQSVFTDLARSAGKLKSETILTAWLYAVARRTAIDAIRKESRRQLREQIAAEMQNMNATANDLSRQSGTAADWTQIEPLLDDAMAALDETDRTAILLRYFENKNLREVGESLKISDDAAQKRVSRAVEKLREFFSKRKITIGAGGFVVLISANAVQSAPIGLAATISATVFAGAAVQTSTVIAATKAIAMTTLQKTIIGAALAAVVGTGIFEARQNSKLQNQIQTLQQQQAPLAEQIRQLQRERDDATNQLAALLAENAQLQSNSNEMELLRLRAKATRLDELANENNNLKMKVSELEGRWRNVTNAPQFSMPYFPRGKWNINGNGDPTEILLSAATAATDGDEAKLSNLISNTNNLSLFSKQRWNDVKGIQLVSIDYQTDANTDENAVGATATVNTIIMKQANGEQIDPNQPPALTDLMQSYPVMHRWYFSKTEDGWKITGGD
jgi:RNA polymerase sigma factor (sigma-70 family)